MKILAIETATEACSAALAIDGEARERYRLAPREHSELILAMIDELMDEADLSVNQLDAVAFGRGPGSFIGVRIAAGVTQGIAFSADLPVCPVSTLAAMSQGSGHDYVLAAIDARMQEVYWGVYERVNGMVRPMGDEVVTPASQVSLPEALAADEVYGIGSGWREQGPNLSYTVKGVLGFEAEVFPRARDVASVGEQILVNGEAVSAEQAQPVYLRDNVARKRVPQSAGH